MPRRAHEFTSGKVLHLIAPSARAAVAGDGDLSVMATLNYDDFLEFLDGLLRSLQGADTHGLLYVAPHRLDLEGSSLMHDMTSHLGACDRLTHTLDGHPLMFIQNTTIDAALRLTRLVRYAFEHVRSDGDDRTAAFGLVLFENPKKTAPELITIARDAAKAADTTARNRIQLVHLTG